MHRCHMCGYPACWCMSVCCGIHRCCLHIRSHLDTTDRCVCTLYSAERTKFWKVVYTPVYSSHTYAEGNTSKQRDLTNLYSPWLHCWSTLLGSCHMCGCRACWCISVCCRTRRCCSHIRSHLTTMVYVVGLKQKKEEIMHKKELQSSCTCLAGASCRSSAGGVVS